MVTENRPGVGVDSKGGAAVDPTRNVLDLVEAAVKRIDDLMNEKFARIRENVKEEVIRIDSIVALRAEYQEKLALAESKRIDAIRTVDVAAVGIASERAAQQATVLANQVSASAETLRALVSSTASQVATSLSQLQSQLTDRIALLEKSQYESKGRAGVSDPMMMELVEEMRKLRDATSIRSGQGIGMSSMWGYVIAAIAAAGAITSIVHVLMSK
jgi:hypothetical protein